MAAAAAEDTDYSSHCRQYQQNLNHCTYLCALTAAVARTCSSDPPAAAAALGGIAQLLRPPLSEVWQQPSCRTDPAAWRPLQATLQHLSLATPQRPSGSELAVADTAAEVVATAVQGVVANASPGGISVGEAATRLQLQLATSAAGCGNKAMALRLLGGETEQDSLDDASPLRLLTGLRTAALLAEQGPGLSPADASAGGGGSSSTNGDVSLQGSGMAPAAAARLCSLLQRLVAPADQGLHCSNGGGGGLLADSGVTVQPLMHGQPLPVMAAAAHGCLLLALWAQVKPQPFSRRSAFCGPVAQIAFCSARNVH